MKYLLLSCSLLLCSTLASASNAVELFEEDAAGNINQRNVGNFKSNRAGAAAGGGIVKKRVRPLKPFKTLKIEIPVEVSYREQGGYRVEIEATREVHDKIQFVYNGSRLSIKGSGFTSNAPVKLTVYGDQLQRVFVNGAATVDLNDIGVAELLLSVRGTSDVSARGNARICIINAMGASDLMLTRLKCQQVTLTAQGSADIQLYAANSIKGRVQGAGDVEVIGNPAQRKLEVLGAYDVDYR